MPPAFRGVQILLSQILIKNSDDLPDAQSRESVKVDRPARILRTARGQVSGKSLDGPAAQLARRVPRNALVQVTLGLNSQTSEDAWISWLQTFTSPYLAGQELTSAHGISIHDHRSAAGP